MHHSEAGVRSLSVYAFDGWKFSRTVADVVQEIPLQVFCNELLLATIACTGIHLDELAVGYLKSEGFIHARRDIADIQVNADTCSVHIFTTGEPLQEVTKDAFRGSIASSGARSRLRSGPGDLPMIRADLQMSPQIIFERMNRFIDLCPLHAGTRGTHGAALADGSGILVVREDIGRHNALDMLAGHAFLNAWDCSDKAILRTGRVSSEIVYKVWSLGTPFVASLAAPTARAVELADKAGITLVGAIRGNTLKVFTHERRVGL
jgi:FdhD protein